MFMFRKTTSASATAAAVLLAFAAGCNAPDVVNADGTTVVTDYSLDPRATVCDPFANNPSYAGAGLDHGIVASLHYLRDDQPRYTNVFDYARYGESLEATLFLSELNVPTRRFDLGFVTQAGETLKNQRGDTLYEYFSLHLESQIQLTANQAEGAYQFALLSDDGSVMSVDVGNGFETLVDNNGQHPTRFAGASHPVTLSRSQALPIQVEYNQGPRFHIALVLMWRPWPQAGGADAAFGSSGNDLFFNSAVVPSAPQQAYRDLLARGWSVVPSANFKLPARIASNPCVPVVSAPVGVSEFCAANAQSPFASIAHPVVGLASDPSEGSSPYILSSLSSMGYSAASYNEADLLAGTPAAQGVNVLILSRLAAVQATSPELGAAIRSFIQSGGSVIGEYDGAALFFDGVGTGSPSVLANIQPSFALFSGISNGGGLLVPVNTSLLTVTDPTDAIMSGVPTSYLQGNKAAFGISGMNSSWLHVSATFSSAGARNWGPEATYPAVMSGRCNKGRVAFFTMSLLNSSDDAPVQQMFSNAIRWVSGNH